MSVWIIDDKNTIVANCKTYEFKESLNPYDDCKNCDLKSTDYCASAPCDLTSNVNKTGYFKLKQ